MLGVKQVIIPLADSMGTKLRIEEDLSFASKWKHLPWSAMQLELGWVRDKVKDLDLGIKAITVLCVNIYL